MLDPKHALSGRGGKAWGVMDMRRALKERLAPYKIPQEMKVVQEVPRNAMGKSECALFRLFCWGWGLERVLMLFGVVNKKNLIKEIWGDAKGA